MALPTGLFVIDPLLLQRNQMAPSVIIRALFVDGKEMTTNDTIAMPVGRADLRFDYTATSLTVPQRVRFRYKLEGYDSEWRDAGDRREASYTRVGPGRYVFRVMACNNDGVWNEIGASLALDVPPTFWQTRWFDLLAVTAGLSLMWLLYRLRLWQVSGQIRRRMESRLQERERIARELHDTLLQSITGLTLHVRAAANQIQVGTALRERLETALARANEALVEGRDRVSELRLHQGPEVSLESRLTNACNNLADEMPGVHCGIKVTGSIRDLNTLVSEEAERIAREAVTNALRHADARDIQVVLDYGRYAFRLSVGDDGSGINGPVEAQPDQPGHFGLAGMRERAARIGGQLEIRSSRHGTTVVLTVPAATAYCPFRQERV
jgi:signal transduction histidine kinase